MNRSWTNCPCVYKYATKWYMFHDLTLIEYLLCINVLFHICCLLEICCVWRAELQEQSWSQRWQVVSSISLKMILSCYSCCPFKIKNFRTFLDEWMRSSRVGRERLTANAVVATFLGSIPASSDTVESEGRQMKQCWISNIKKSPFLS